MFVNRLNHQRALVNSKKQPSLLMAIYFGLCLLLLVSLARNISFFLDSRKELQESKKLLEEEGILLSESKKKLEQINSKSYTEKVARDTLGLARPEEIVLVFPQNADLKRLSPRLFEKKQIEVKEPNYKKWLRLLF